MTNELEEMAIIASFDQDECEMKNCKNKIDVQGFIVDDEPNERSLTHKQQFYCKECYNTKLATLRTFQSNEIELKEQEKPSPIMKNYLDAWASDDDGT